MSKKNEMLEEYDFSKGKRGPVILHKGKTRITIFIDTDILEWFKDEVEREGRDIRPDQPGFAELYQTGQTPHSGPCERGGTRGA